MRLSGHLANFLFYTVNAYGYLRKYDIRCRKPTNQTSVKELGAVPDYDEIFTCIDENQKNEIMVGGNRGSTLLLDSRQFPQTKPRAAALPTFDPRPYRELERQQKQLEL